MWSRLTLFAGNSNTDLAQKVCAQLEISPGKALIGRFSDGEIRVELCENVRGKDIYVLQSTCPPVNENLMELLVIIDALKRASARRVSVIIPYYGYGRQDQKNKPRVPIAAKVVADLLSIAGADHVITIDLHADQIQGFFRIPVDHLLGTTALIEAIRGELTGDEIVIAPDANGTPRARFFAERLKLDLAIMDNREKNGSYPRIVGNVKGRKVIILDDMIDTGKTVVRTAGAACQALAASITVCAVHPLFSGMSVEKIEESAIEKVLVTDTIPLCEKAKACGKIHVVSIAPMIAEVIKRLHFEESISSIFREY
ncbi:MAG: ribose-phosphate pyrophosphokinase [Syntrophobacteraceae bacterium]|nr:ribose-phosphate pyrophosphokinase [Syntrophobacteraceae bacterium]